MIKENIDGTLEQQGSVDYTELMTDEQIARGAKYANQYLIRRAEIDTAYKEEWDYLQKLYECKRDRVADDPDFPNSFIPLLTPTVEGQVASMMESQIDFFHISSNPGHEIIMSQLDAASEYYRKKSRFKDHLKDFSRYYDLLGNCYLNIAWEDNISNNPRQPNGYPRINVPPLLSILVDGSIKDSKDIQYAQYIIQEIGHVTLGWAIEEYGEKYANAISMGINRIEGQDEDYSADDEDTFMLLHYWTRDRKTRNLMLIEMDTNGLILRESGAEKPYHKYVDNEYPFTIGRMIPQLGKFYGIGDGAILKPMQEVVNNLTDELELAARFSAQSKIAVDPNANMSGEQLTTNPADPIYCEDPRGNIMIIPGGGVNPIVMQMIQFLLAEAQKATRFHDIMTGNMQGSSATATQVNTQMAQGSVGIKDKKSDIAEVMKWADMYALKLCMENWDKPFWSSVGKNYQKYIDIEAIAELPVMMPTSSETMMKAIQEAQETGDETPPLSVEEAKDKDGNAIMAQLDFETEVIIGNDMPKGRTDMYNILLGLAQIMVTKPDGTQGPLVSATTLRSKLEEILGMKLRTQKEEEREATLDQQQQEQLNQQQLNTMNPVGQGGTIQTPQNPMQAPPENLASIPGRPGDDQRRQV